MKYDSPAQSNPIDQERFIGKSTKRIDGPLKTTGSAKYAYERHDIFSNPAVGFIVGATIPKGRIRSMDLAAAKAMPGVIDIISARDVKTLEIAKRNTAKLLGGPEVQHFHQAIAIVVAATFEQARAAASLVRVNYERAEGNFDLVVQKEVGAVEVTENTPDIEDGDFTRAFDRAPVKIDHTYHTPDQSHAMMEPHATMAAWDGGKLTVWTSNQMIEWAKTDIATTLGLSADQVRVVSPYIGGGFGVKLFIRADVILAALAAQVVQRPVKVTLTRPQLMNNTTHRPATIQRIRLAADREGKLLAIGHDNCSGDLPGGGLEQATQQTALMYASQSRLIRNRLAVLDLPEGNAMRAPGEAPGLMAFEMAMDELAEELAMDPVQLRIVNDTQVDPLNPERPYSRRNFVLCFREGAERFGWSNRSPKPAQRRDGHWLLGMGMAAAFRNNMLMASAARVRLQTSGQLIVETDMTDIGTGSYTIIAQTAAEMLGLPLEQIDVRLGDSDFPVSAGSGGQWGGNSSTAGVYAACVTLRQQIGERLGMDGNAAMFQDGQVITGDEKHAITSALADGELIAEEGIDYANVEDSHQQSTFGSHFVEVAVNQFTGETRIRRMLAVCDAGRILNPMSARSQVIGAMTMGVGGALMEELAVDPRLGYFVNHDLAGYEVPVHGDIPHQEVVFLDDVDPYSSPMKAKGVGELGLCGVGAAVANAIYNATGMRVRHYPISLDKYLDRLPAYQTV